MAESVVTWEKIGIIGAALGAFLGTMRALGAWWFTSAAEGQALRLTMTAMKEAHELAWAENKRQQESLELRAAKKDVVDLQFKAVIERLDLVIRLVQGHEGFSGTPFPEHRT